MKKSILLIALLMTCFMSRAQDDPNTVTEGQNELKVNALFLVVGSFEVTYEYLLNDETGIGVSVFLPYDEDIKENINYYISPYYRFYFGNKFASGFFLEGFGMLNSVNNRTYYYDVLTSIETYEEVKTTDFALGIGLGGKWITKRGLLGEINLGVGRNLFNGNETGDDLVGKVGVTVGYRF